MKKIFLALTAVLLSGILFTSASPSLDGRAVVADVGVFPRGYFAKTVGYLPGDSIKVTNPVNGERIDILVIGSLDASDGVAILLSPEAAEALSIKKNSNNLVKLTKRNGTADDIVNGSAYITKGDGFEGYDAEEFAQAEDEANETEEDFAEEFAQADDEVSDENFSDDIVIIDDEENVGEEFAQAEDEADEAEEDFAEEFAQADDENLSDEVAVIEDEIAEEEDFSEEFAQDEASEEDISDEFVFVEDEIPEDEIFEDIHEELVRDDIPEEFDDSAEYEYVEADDIFEDEQKANFSERVIEEEIPEEYAFESEFEKIEDAEIAEEFVESDFVNAEEFAESETELEEEYLFESEDELAQKGSDIEEDLMDESLFENDEYDAIVLVPSDENPPAPRKEDADKNESRVPEKAASEETPSPKKETSYTAATELAPRKYYVQIAVYNEAENVEEVNALYGKRYPLVVLENGRRKTVMVGPFNVDEYGIILERFKAYGFKDAFVKNTF